MSLHTLFTMIFSHNFSTMSDIYAM